MEKKSIVFFTTQTSASASMWRVLMEINRHASLQGGESRFIRHLGHEYFTGELPANFRWDDIPKSNVLIHHNVSHLITGNFNPCGMKFVVNFRDPRDVNCNQFYWQRYHKEPHETNDEFENRISILLELGMDNWILRRIPRDPYSLNDYYNKFMAVVEQIPDTDRCIATYAQICLSFDAMIKKLTDFFEIELTAQLMQDLSVERPDNLDINKSWIGNQWIGGDTAPGRYKRELKIETIEELNRSYQHILAQMGKLDTEFSGLYV